VAIRVGKFDPVDMAKTRITGETWLHLDDAEAMAIAILDAIRIANG
jgi:hypothetical protein